MYMIRTIAVATTFMLIFNMEASSQWSSNIKVNTPICIEGHDQEDVKIIDDGQGGAIIAWIDRRNNNNYNIYAQRINQHGEALWMKNGIRVSPTMDILDYNFIANPSANNIIFAWSYIDNNQIDVRAQCINFLGYTQWDLNGVTISSENNHQDYPQICQDGLGGAIITWVDFRNNQDYNIFAQRIDKSGVVQWANNGVPVCTNESTQSNVKMISDELSGAIIVWQDNRNGNVDIYAARIDIYGNNKWSADGVPVCLSEDVQRNIDIVGDGECGAIIIWEDNRNGNKDIYAQHVNLKGEMLWANNGIIICADFQDQSSPVVFSRNHKSVIVWHDYRTGHNANSDIYAQLVNDNGNIIWISDGIPICTYDTYQYYPAVTIDDANVATIGWMDKRGGEYDIYAQRIDLEYGTELWESNGRAIMGKSRIKTVTNCKLIGSNNGQVIFAWNDSRNGNQDIFCQNVDRYGILGDASPNIIKVNDVLNDQGGIVTVMWDRSFLDSWPDNMISYYGIWRGFKPEQIQNQARLLVQKEYLNKLSHGELLKDSYLQFNNSNKIYWQYVDSVPAYQLDGYSCNVQTSSDKLLNVIPWHYFMVSAHVEYPYMYTTEPTMIWFSQPDSGYSIDNLAPQSPQNVAGEVYDGNVRLTWKPNLEPDLLNYEIFRGTEPEINPNIIEPLATTNDTVFVDDSPIYNEKIYYFVCAQDLHNNISSVSESFSLIISDLDENNVPVLNTFKLDQNYPNPFNSETIIEFTIPEKCLTKLTIYNSNGNEVKNIVNEVFDTNQVYRIKFDAQNLPTGLYFYKLQAGEFVTVKKMIIIK